MQRARVRPLRRHSGTSDCVNASGPVLNKRPPATLFGLTSGAIPRDAGLGTGFAVWRQNRTRAFMDTSSPDRWQTDARKKAGRAVCSIRRQLLIPLPAAELIHQLGIERPVRCAQPKWQISRSRRGSLSTRSPDAIAAISMTARPDFDQRWMTACRLARRNARLPLNSSPGGRRQRFRSGPVRHRIPSPNAGGQRVWRRNTKRRNRDSATFCEHQNAVQGCAQRWNHHPPPANVTIHNPFRSELRFPSASVRHSLGFRPYGDNDWRHGLGNQRSSTTSLQNLSPGSAWRWRSRQ